jgi:SAM-dependent methyltransferase
MAAVGPCIGTAVAKETAMAWVPSAPRAFQSAVPYYHHRPPYPAALIERVGEICGLRPGMRVLDLGCGPGTLSVPFAGLGLDVVGVDPEPAMLAAAAEAARAAGVAPTFRRGSSFDLPPGLGRFHAAIMGRSFHWMDRAAMLENLDRMIEPDGAVVLFGERRLPLEANRWRKPFEEAIARYTREDDAGHWGHRGGEDWTPHEDMLLASPFDDLERIGRIERHALDLEAAIGRALSRSPTAPAALGERQPAFERELRAALTPFLRDGLLHEVVEGTALIAKRS